MSPIDVPISLSTNSSIYTIVDIFTPTQPAKLAFIDRELVEEDLVEALETPGTQVVIYGNTGSGKTTLLTNTLSKIYENHITSQCMKGTTFESLIIDAFDQIAPLYSSEKITTQQNSVKASLSSTVNIIKAGLEANSTRTTRDKELRILPPQLTPQALGKLLGTLNQCWVIEDFHKVNEDEKVKLSQLLKVFMDLAAEFPSLKIICLGAVDTAREVVKYDPEMRNRVAEILVPLMSDEELTRIVNKGEQLLNIRFEQSVKKNIVNYSSGVASICHQLCLNMCRNAGLTYRQSTLTSIDQDCFYEAVKKYIRKASDTLKDSFDNALRQRNKTKYDSSEIIIKALSTTGDKGLARLKLLRKIQEENPKYTEAILKPHLEKLLTLEYGSIIKYDSNSGLYSFQDPFYRAYAQTLLYEKIKSKTSTINTENNKTLTQEIMFQTMRAEKDNIDFES